MKVIIILALLATGAIAAPPARFFSSFQAAVQRLTFNLKVENEVKRILSGPSSTDSSNKATEIVSNVLSIYNDAPSIVRRTKGTLRRTLNNISSTLGIPKINSFAGSATLENVALQNWAEDVLAIR